MLHFLLSLFASGWQPLPPLGYSNPLTVHGMGDTLLVCGTGGCARTRDQGRSWQPHRVDEAYALAPVFSGLTGVTGYDNTLHRSLDGGRTWSSWSEGIEGDKFIRSVEIRGDLAIAAAYDRADTWNQDGFVQTCNWYLRNLGDDSWRRIDRKPTNNDLCRMFHIGAAGRLFRSLDTLVPGETYARDLSQTSLDQGATWTSFEVGRTVSRVDGSREAFLLGSSSTGGMLSFDSGRTWSDSFPRFARPLVLDGALSLDDTTPWRSLGSGQSRVLFGEARGLTRGSARVAGRLWAIGPGSILASDDSGRSWLPPATFPPLDTRLDLIARPEGVYTLANRHSLSTYDLLASRDAFRTWTRLLADIQPRNFLACGADLLLTYATRGSQGWFDPRQAHLRILEGGTLDSTSSDACPTDPLWDSVAFVSFGSGPARQGQWIVKIPDFHRVSSRARVPGGIFLVLTYYGRQVLAFAGTGSDSAIEVMRLPGSMAANLLETPAGAFLASGAGLHRCTSPGTCVRAPLPGTDTTWGASSLQVHASGLVSAFGIQLDERRGNLRLSRRLLHLSHDTGRTWKSLDLPGVPGSIAEVPSGILLSTDGAGLWHLDSASIRLAGTGIGPARVRTPSFRVTESSLQLAGVSPGVQVLVVDAVGRLVLRVHPEVSDGKASVRLPEGVSGILFAEVRNDGTRTVHRWMSSRP